ncbi:MAG: DNA helicase RecQ [Bacteroidales bacterium]
MEQLVSSGILESTLQRYFGYNSFRPLQKEIIQNVLKGKDSVVLMPTGGGKSICYQLPAIVSEGLTLVISPLIALMKDQVESLQSNGISAAYLNSSLTPEETEVIKNKLRDQSLNLLYVAPERLFSGNFIEYLKTLNLNLIAIDEAHCVSSWGHHFRPEYKKLSILKNVFPQIPVIALTATADKAVRRDIGDLLNLHNPEFFISSFDRPNLSLSVLPGQKKWEQILQIVNRHPGQSGIIYCLSRKGTESLANKLQSYGINAKYYHAGLENKERQKTQEQFLQGEVDIICATIAFGMGIDKPDIRFVIHQNMPGNIESYYQEIGRAGRDGKPAETVLFYSYRDVQNQLSFINDIEDEQYRKIQLVKLKRMQEYAEAQICRRKILLSYFGEIIWKDCGNCDVCNNPPEYYDGTMQAQMALSAMHRLNERATISALVDVLKGSYSDVVRSNKFHTIKTFGKGKNITAFAWQMYIQQMLQQGVMELDYKDHYTLKLNEESRKVLFEGKKVQLVHPETIEKRKAQKRSESKPRMTKAQQARQNLFEELRKLRKKIAESENKPAFAVFTDASLNDMIDKLPGNFEELLCVEGVGEYKAQKYGNEFLQTITDFLAETKETDTYKTTWALYNKGYSIKEVANKRNLQETTIYSHIAKLISDGYSINIYELIKKEELDAVKSAITQIGQTKQLKPYYQYFKGEMDYGKIRLALSYLERNSR